MRLFTVALMVLSAVVGMCGLSTAALAAGSVTTPVIVYHAPAVIYHAPATVYHAPITTSRVAPAPGASVARHLPPGGMPHAAGGKIGHKPAFVAVTTVYTPATRADCAQANKLASGSTNRVAAAQCVTAAKRGQN